jgi:hypothetical protein
MARTKISEFSATAADNTDIDNIDIAEGCAPSGINNAIRELMAQLKDMQTGASGDTFTLTTVNSTAVNATTVDATNLEVTNLKAKDGTAAGSIANSTGVVTLTSLAGTTANITNVNATTLDATNLELTTLKAKDGTAAGSIADSTGVVTLASAVLTTADINGGTLDGVAIGASTPSTGVFTTVTDANGKIRAVPQSGSAKTTSYTLATGDVGEYIEIGSGGSVTIPDATFSAGDIVSLFNNTSGDITVTCTITTAYIGGTNTDKATVTLATRGVATILFISGTLCVIQGNVT